MASSPAAVLPSRPPRGLKPLNVLFVRAVYRPHLPPFRLEAGGPGGSSATVAACLGRGAALLQYPRRCLRLRPSLLAPGFLRAFFSRRLLRSSLQLPPAASRPPSPSSGFWGCPPIPPASWAPTRGASSSSPRCICLRRHTMGHHHRPRRRPLLRRRPRRRHRKACRRHSVQRLRPRLGAARRRFPPPQLLVRQHLRATRRCLLRHTLAATLDLLELAVCCADEMLSRVVSRLVLKPARMT